MKPHLTKISQEYCKDEYVKDTDDFIRLLEEHNDYLRTIPKNRRPKYHLCTLDVKALYPSIRTEVALESLEEAC